MWFRTARASRPRTRKNFRPIVELLEDRRLMSVVNWVGGSGNWSDSSHWLDATTMTNHVPGAADDAVISGAGISVTHSAVTDSVNSLTSSAAFEVFGGKLSVAADSSFTNTSIPSVLALGGGGEISGTGNIVINGGFDWTSGTLSVSTMTANGATNFTGGNLNCSFINNGAFTWSSGNMTVGASGVFNNSVGATFDITGSGSWAGGIFNNLGTYTKIAGSSNVGTTFNNSGMVHVKSGDLTLGGITTPLAVSSGVFVGDAGTTLQIQGPHNFTASSSIAADHMNFYLSTGTVAGAYSAGSTFIQTNPPQHISFTGNVSAVGPSEFYGQVDFSPSAGPVTLTLPSLILGGTLSGTDSVIINGSFGWSGNLNVAGTITANGATNFTGGSLNCSFINNGAFTWSSGNMTVGAGGVFTNAAGATFDITGNGSWAGGTFNNLGTYTKVAGSSNVGTTFNNTGMVHVESGDLTLGGITTPLAVSSGVFVGDAGTTLQIQGPHNFTASSSIAADHMNFYLSTGTVAGAYSAGSTFIQTNPPQHISFTGNVSAVGPSEFYGQVDFSPSAGPVTLTPPSLILGGTLSGTDSVIINGSFGWSGNLNVAGTITANGATNFTGGSLNCSFINNGAFTWSSGNMTVGAGGVFTNAAGATFDITGNGSWAGGTFNNLGTYTKVAGSSNVGTTFNNSGMVHVKSGDLTLGGITTPLAVSSGAFVGDAGTILQIQGPHEFTASSSIAADQVIFYLASVKFAGILSANSTSFTGSAIFVPGSTFTTGAFSMESSTGTADFQLGAPNSGTGYDQIQVGTVATLAIGLQLELVNGFTPALLSQFAIVHSTNPIPDHFRGLAENGIITLGLYQFQITYHGGACHNDVVLTTIATPILNHSPTAVDDNYSTFEDGAVSNNVLTNDSDPDSGDTLTVSEVNGNTAAVGQPVAAAHGTVIVNANGAFTYTPGTDCEGTSDSFTYTISDGHGGTGTATVTITIMQYTGVSTSGGILRVGGTAGADVVTVSGGSLIVNGTPHSLTGVTEVRIWGRDGNDQIDLSGLSINSFIHGGHGNDVLTGGAGDDVILGGEGNDTITGAAGNDFLVGGAGADRIVGSAGHDILVAGDIGCELGLAALRAVSQAWAATRTVAADAVDDFLDETLFTDDAVDQLTGSAGADLFIISTGDKITDFQFGKPQTNKDGDVVIKDGVVAV